MNNCVSISMREFSPSAKARTPSPLRVKLLEKEEERSAIKKLPSEPPPSEPDEEDARDALAALHTQWLEDLSNFLASLRGTALRGFRMDLDGLEAGRCPHSTFVSSCRTLGVAGRRVWSSLQRGGREAIRFHELCPEEAADVDDFVRRLIGLTGLDMDVAWSMLDWRGANCVTLHQFAVFAKQQLEFEGNVVRLFRGLDVRGHGRIGLEELVYVVKVSSAADWLRASNGSPAPELIRWIIREYKTFSEFRKALGEVMGPFSERDAIPVGNFAAAIFRLGFPGDALALAQRLARSTKEGTEVELSALSELLAYALGHGPPPPASPRGRRAAEASASQRRAASAPSSASGGEGAQGRGPGAAAEGDAGGAFGAGGPGSPPTWNSRCEDFSLRNRDRCATQRDYFRDAGPSMFAKRQVGGALGEGRPPSPRIATRGVVLPFGGYRPPAGPPTVDQLLRASSAAAADRRQRLADAGTGSGYGVGGGSGAYLGGGGGGGRESMYSLSKWSVLSCSTVASSAARDELDDAEAADFRGASAAGGDDGFDGAESVRSLGTPRIAMERKRPFVFLRFLRQTKGDEDTRLMLFMDEAGALHHVHHDDWPVSDLPGEMQFEADSEGNRVGVFYLTYMETPSTGRKDLSSISFHEFLDGFALDYVLSKLDPQASRNVRSLLRASKERPSTKSSSTKLRGGVRASSATTASKLQPKARVGNRSSQVSLVSSSRGALTPRSQASAGGRASQLSVRSAHSSADPTRMPRSSSASSISFSGARAGGGGGGGGGGARASAGAARVGQSLSSTAPAGALAAATQRQSQASASAHAARVLATSDSRLSQSTLRSATGPPPPGVFLHAPPEELMMPLDVGAQTLPPNVLHFAAAGGGGGPPPLWALAKGKGKGKGGAFDADVGWSAPQIPMQDIAAALATTWPHPAAAAPAKGGGKGAGGAAKGGIAGAGARPMARGNGLKGKAVGKGGPLF